MKRLHLVLFMILFSSMLIFSCDSQENFAVKNIEILNQLGDYNELSNMKQDKQDTNIFINYGIA